MAKTEGGDNKIFQIVMVVITSIVAPLVIFFTTSAYKNPSQPTPPAIAQSGETAPVQQANPSAAPTLPAQIDGTTPTVVAGVSSTITLTATPTSAPKTSTATVTATPLPNTPTATATQTSAAAAATSSPASLTSGSSALVAVGTPVVADNFALTLGVQDIRLEGGAIRVTLRVKNLGETARQFTFTAAGVTVSDGKRLYAPYFGTKKSACQKADLTKERTITIDPQQEVVISSTTEKEGTAWCASGKDSTLPFFIGPVSKSAARLQVTIKNLGPFTGFAFDVPLKR